MERCPVCGTYMDYMCESNGFGGILGYYVCPKCQHSTLTRTTYTSSTVTETQGVHWSTTTEGYKNI